METLAERWAMTDVSRQEVEERVGFSLTDSEWETILEEAYEDGQDVLLDCIEDIVGMMECENAPA